MKSLCGDQNLDVVCETSVERLEELLVGSDYAVAMIDSVQTCVTEDSVSGAGSVATLRAVADRMMNLAKSNEITLVLAGHVTKDGQVPLSLSLSQQLRICSVWAISNVSYQYGRYLLFRIPVWPISTVPYGR